MPVIASWTAALARSLHATNAPFMPLSTRPLWGLGYHRPSSLRMPRAHYLMPIGGVASTARQEYKILARRPSSVKDYQQERVPSLFESKSLRSTSGFDTSPASFGVWAWKGYDAFILPGTRLPCRQTAIFESEFDDVEGDVLRICFCPPLKGDFKVIAELLVSGIRKAKKKDTGMTLIMDLDEDLTGNLTARFTPREDTIKGEVSIKFDGREAGLYKRDNVIITL